jgi:hypothetical protein
MAFPTKVDGDTIDADDWNALNTYRLIHAETYDFDSGDTSYFKDYSYIANAAASGVLIVATIYNASESTTGGDMLITFTVKVDDVIKETKHIHQNIASDRWVKMDNPINTLLTSDDMTFDENHTIRVGSDRTTDKVTSLLVYVK